MSIGDWIEEQRRLKVLNTPKYNHTANTAGKGLWTRCDNCGVILYIKHLKENLRVCFGCGFHLQMESQERIDHLLDEATWRPIDQTLSPCDPLGFVDQKPYTERLLEAQERTGFQDAIQTGTGVLDGIPVALGVMDFQFMGGSMGSVVGEKITRLVEYATQEGLPLILVCASGGARMQEGILSLMQMAKISAALQVHQSCAKLFYVSILTSPTTGGVTASFAMLGDLVFAEPKALIGFAGRRVIEQTLQEELPDDFQTSEYLLNHGLLDLIIPRCYIKQALSEILTLYQEAPLKRLGKIPYGVGHSLSPIAEEKVRRRAKEWDATFKRVGTGGESKSDLTANLSPPSTLEMRDELLPSRVGLSEDDTELGESLLQDSSRDTLLSFEAMLTLYLDKCVDTLEVTPIISPVDIDLKRQDQLPHALKQPFEVDREEATPSNESIDDGRSVNDSESESDSESVNDGGSEGTSATLKRPLLERLIALAQEKTVEWRALYTASTSSGDQAPHSDINERWREDDKVDKELSSFAYRILHRVSSLVIKEADTF